MGAHTIMTSRPKAVRRVEAFGFRVFFAGVSESAVRVPHRPDARWTEQDVVGRRPANDA